MLRRKSHPQELDRIEMRGIPEVTKDEDAILAEQDPTGLRVTSQIKLQKEEKNFSAYGDQ